jgi:hypothetical protein
MNMNLLELVGDNAIDRNAWLHNLLVSGTYNITFTKVNGETRVMPCTLESSKLPPVVIKETVTKDKPTKPDTLRVWCIDKQEWRSFRVMSVTEVKELEYGK